MKNSRIFGILMTSMFLFAFCVSVFAQDAAKIDAAQLFKDKKCISCHSLDGAGIASTNPNHKGPDLSAVGTKYKADFLMKYLSKEETINDKKHGMKFNGTEDEFKALTDWLASQKPADAK